MLSLHKSLKGIGLPSIDINLNEKALSSIALASSELKINKIVIKANDNLYI